MNYEETAKRIVEILGKDNIKSVTHCVTRLRFKLKDEDSINHELIKEVPGVLGTMRKGGQYQVIIGNEVAKCYKEVQKLGVSSDPEVEETVKKKSGKDIINSIFDYISGSMSGLVPALIGGGIIKVILILLPMAGWLSKDSSTYAFLTFFGDAPFYFMPMMIAYTASKKMDVTPVLAITVAGIMLHPNFTAMAAQGNAMDILGLPVTAVSYASTVIPILIMVWLMKYIEKVLHKIIPSILQSFLTPFLIIVVSGMIALIVVGPLGSFAGNWLYDAIMWVQQYAGWLAMAFIAAFMPLIVMTGMHWALAVFAIVCSQQNPDTLLLPAMLVSNLAQGAACIIVGLRSKNKELKATSFSAGILALLAGITEPAMYGVTLKLKKPLIATMIAGAIGGVLVGVLNLETYAFSVPSLTALPAFISETGNSNFTNALIIAGVTIIATSVITWFMTNKMETESTKDVEMNTEITVETGFSDPKKIMSPLTGSVVSLSKVNDATFAQELIGKGLAVIPENGVVCAPFDGSVEALFPSKHAVGLKSTSGIEVLIHVGLDTVNLNGKYFETNVKIGDHVKMGDPLLKFDIEKIKEEGYDIVTPVIVTNTNDYIDVIAKDIDYVRQSEPLIIVM